MRKTLTTVAIAAMILSEGVALASDRALSCEAAKLKLAAKYGLCRLSAESTATKLSESPDYSKCSLAKFSDAEARAVGQCPTLDDQSAIQIFMDDLTVRMGDWFAGSGDLTITCPADLVTCQSDLAASLSDCVASLRPPLSSGQTACYDSSGTVIACGGTGQDGELQKGAPHSFTDNGDGTITDNTTSLMWEKISDDGTIHDLDNYYSWTDAFAVKIGTLNSQNFAGHNDWRLPNLPEIESIRNIGGMSPATFSVFQTGCAPGCSVLTCNCTLVDARGGLFWTSSTFMNSEDAWLMLFDTGRSIGEGRSSYWYNMHNVRAVRGGL
ncbi:MAG TPA: DUF1566 domain-containing protein [Candidatus Binatia bacterium]|jgi:hypothetical protein